MDEGPSGQREGLCEEPGAEEPMQSCCRAWNGPLVERGNGGGWEVWLAGQAGSGFCALLSRARTASEGLQAMEFCKQVYFWERLSCALWAQWARGSLGDLSSSGEVLSPRPTVTWLDQWRPSKVLLMPASATLTTEPTTTLGDGGLIQWSPPWCDTL